MTAKTRIHGLRLRALGLAIFCYLSAVPAYSAVDLIGAFNPGLVVSDPWIITDGTSIGSQQATFLDVHDGGTVDSTSASFLRLGDGSNLATYVQVNVRDAGSTLTANNLIFRQPAVTRMFIENGGTVTVNDDIISDFTLGTTNSTVVVSGSGSQLTVGDEVSLLDLVITDGATVQTGTSNAGSTGNLKQTSFFSATLRGASSTWIDHNVMQVTGTLNVEDGAHLTSTGNLLGSSFRVADFGEVHLNGGVITAEEIAREDAGRFYFHSGTLTLNQSGLTVGDAGLLRGTVRIDPVSTIDVSGEVVVDSDSELFIEGTLISSGLTNNGSLILRDATLNQAVTSPAGSTINVLGDTTFNGLVSGAGGIFGSGTATFNGGYSPGDSPAVVPIETDLAFGLLSSLEIELAGTAVGAFDQLSVAGDVSLDGTLGVSIIDGFTLSPGQQFTILEIAGESTGQFAGLPEGALVGNFGGVDVSISYAAGDGNNVALFAMAIPEPAAAMLLALAVCASLGTRGRYRPCFRQLCVCLLVFGGLRASPCWADIEHRGDVDHSGTPNGTERFLGPWNTVSLKVGNLGSGELAEPGLVVIGNDPGSSATPGAHTVNVDDDIYIGVQNPGTVLISGEESLLTSGGLIYVGQGDRGLLLATAGATVETGDAWIGSSSGGGAGMVEISDNGTSWSHYDLSMATTSELVVRNSATVFTENVARVSGHITVTGPGSVWDTGGLTMSSTGSASVVVADGGHVNVRGAHFVQQFMMDPVFSEDEGIRVSGGSIIIRGGTFTTNYFAQFAPGDLNLDYGAVNLTDSGLVVGAGGLMGDTIDIVSGSAINLSDDATVEAGASLIVAGTLSSASLNNHGTLTLIDTTLDQPVTNQPGSTTDVIGDVVFNDLVSGASNFLGSGDAHFGGGYRPGDGPALVSIEGSATFTESNTLFLEIGGETPGVDHDRIEVGGFTTLAGTLDVTLLDGFVPELGDSFAVLFSSGGFDANFTTLALPDLSSEGLDWELNPGGAALFLEAVPALDGDFNLDGTVDTADYTVWRDGLGTAFTPSDYTVWKNSFGATGSPPSLAVPEPTGGGLLVVMIGVGSLTRSRNAASL